MIVVASSTGVAQMPAAADRSSAGATDEYELVDRAGAAGVSNPSIKSFSASGIDYNRDGRQDAWIGNHGRGGTLWRNVGRGRYVPAETRAWPTTNPEGKVIDRHDCEWADVDRNGRPDAYCSTGRFRRNLVKSGRDNELWLQSKDATFRDRGTRWGVGDPCGRGRFVAFLNANGDRYPDLFLGNERPRDVPDECNEPGSGLPNERSKLFLNSQGDGFRYARRFLQVPAGPGTRCAEVLDFDQDGDDDLLLCRDTLESPVLYRNNNENGFSRISMPSLDEPVTDVVVTRLDANNHPDLVTASPDKYSYYLNLGGAFAEGVVIGTPPDGEGNSVAAGDADGDGDVDVFGALGGPGTANADDVLWVNDALTFSPLIAPSAAGTADQVTALKPHGSVRSQFLVQNGGFGRRTPPGPTQLIQMVRP